MASIMDSFSENFNERFAVFKYLIFAVPVYFSYQLYIGTKEDYTGFYWLLGLTLFFIFGLLIKVTNNVSNERLEILPPLNPLFLAFSSFKGILAIGPLYLICSLLANFIGSFLSGLTLPFEIATVVQYIIWILAIALIVASFMMFSYKESISDSYNIKILFEKAGDLIISLLSFIIKFSIANLLITTFIGYILFVLFAFGPILLFYIAFAIVFNIGVIGHYLGQLNCELIIYGNNKKKIN